MSGLDNVAKMAAEGVAGVQCHVDRAHWPEWARLAWRAGALRRYARDRGVFLADWASMLDDVEWMAISGEATEALHLAKELERQARWLRYGHSFTPTSIAICPRCDQLYLHPVTGPRCPSCKFNLAASDTGGELV